MLPFDQVNPSPFDQVNYSAIVLVLELGILLVIVALALVSAALALVSWASHFLYRYSTSPCIRSANLIGGADLYFYYQLVSFFTCVYVYVLMQDNMRTARIRVMYIFTNAQV